MILILSSWFIFTLLDYVFLGESETKCWGLLMDLIILGDLIIAFIFRSKYMYL